jgi:hypothetical protein
MFENVFQSKSIQLYCQCSENNPDLITLLQDQQLGTNEMMRSAAWLHAVAYVSVYSA